MDQQKSWTTHSENAAEDAVDKKPAPLAAEINAPDDSVVDLVGITEELDQPSATLQGSPTKVWFHINFDGGSRGNPGLAGAGAEVISRVFTSENKGKVQRSKTKIRAFLGVSGKTNNQAEYQGAISGLEHAVAVLTKIVGKGHPKPAVTLAASTMNFFQRRRCQRMQYLRLWKLNSVNVSR